MYELVPRLLVVAASVKWTLKASRVISSGGCQTARRLIEGIAILADAICLTPI